MNSNELLRNPARKSAGLPDRSDSKRDHCLTPNAEKHVFSAEPPPIPQSFFVIISLVLLLMVLIFMTASANRRQDAGVSAEFSAGLGSDGIIVFVQSQAPRWRRLVKAIAYVDQVRPRPVLLSQASKFEAAHYRILGLGWEGWLFEFYDSVLFTFLVGPIAHEFHLTKLQISWALGASLAASALGGIAFGSVADQCGRRRVLQWTIITYIFGTLFYQMATGLWSMIAFRAITGIGVGGEWAPGHTYIGETLRPRLRGSYAATLQTGASSRALLVTGSSGVIEPRTGWRLCFMVSAAPAVLSAFVRRASPESDVWLQKHPRARSGRALSFLRPSQIFKPIASSLQGLHRERLMRCFALSTLDMSVFWIAFSWLPKYFTEEHHLSLLASTSVMATAYVRTLISNISFGWIADRVGRRIAFTTFSLVLAIGLLSITKFWRFVALKPRVHRDARDGTWVGNVPRLRAFHLGCFPTAVSNSAMGGTFNLDRDTPLPSPALGGMVAQSCGFEGGIVLGRPLAIAAGIFVRTFADISNRLVTEVK
jgi:MFS family permease